MKERLRLRHYSFGERKPDKVVDVEYVRKPHDRTGSLNAAGRAWVAYDVLVDGELCGSIAQATKSTDRNYNRIRVPGKGRVAWSWTRADRTSNRAGCYERTRRNAVAELLEYSEGMRA